jgi:hypothetical protein
MFICRTSKLSVIVIKSNLFDFSVLLENRVLCTYEMGRKFWVFDLATYPVQLSPRLAAFSDLNFRASLTALQSEVLDLA